MFFFVCSQRHLPSQFFSNNVLTRVPVETRVIHYLRQAPNLRAQRQKSQRRISVFLIQSSAGALSVLDLINEYSQLR